MQYYIFYFLFLISCMFIVTCKSLILRGLLPPPISLCKVNNRLTGIVLPALLHQAYASCGRVLSCLFCFLMGLLSLGFASCEKPYLHDEELEAYYEESLHLDMAPRDSVIRFSSKVQQYVSINPL